jgi:hypothetical protein
MVPARRQLTDLPHVPPSKASSAAATRPQNLSPARTLRLPRSEESTSAVFMPFSGRPLRRRIVDPLRSGEVLYPESEGVICRHFARALRHEVRP